MTNERQNDRSSSSKDPSGGTAHEKTGGSNRGQQVKDNNHPSKSNDRAGSSHDHDEESGRGRSSPSK